MRAFSLFSLALVLAGCASSLPPRSDASEPARARPVYAPVASTPDDRARSSDDAVTRRLDRAVDGWLGTPYRLGGTGRDGIDCSAFVQTVYADALAVDLPRTTEAQVTVGTPVDTDALATGDLVFFRPDGKTRHVGIFLGDGVFAHASTSQGVTRSRLDAPYWRGAYWTSRRVLATPPASVAKRQPPLRRTPSEPVRPASAGRVGW